MTSALASDRVRFGEFEVDLRSHELLRRGRRVRLQEKSFLALRELLAQAGRVVTREDLGAALWPREHFVDVEHGLNTAIRRLRGALGDSAEAPRFVETVPKLGYRFVAAVEAVPAAAVTVTDAAAPATAAEPATVAISTPTPAAPAAPASPRSLARPAVLAAAVVAVVALAAVVAVNRWPQLDGGVAPPPPAPPGRAEDPVVTELLARARYLRNHKRPAEARQFVDEALLRDPASPEALAGLSLSLLGEGQPEEAREVARRAIELDPRTWEAHRTLGHLAHREGDYVGAERHYRRATEANPNDYKTRNRLARHLLECGRLDEARPHLEETRRRAPDDPDVQNIWMSYSLLRGDYEDALRQGRMWIVIWDQQIESLSATAVHDMLGLAYIGARRHEEAIAHFRARDPGDDLGVALALAHAGRAAEARAILAPHEASAAATGSPVDPALAAAMAKVYVVAGDFDHAFGHLDRQVAAGDYPSWLHVPLFRPITGDPRWPAFANRLEETFFSGRPAPREAGAGNARLPVGR